MNRRPEKYGVAAAFYGEDCMNEVLELLQTITQGNKKVDYDDPGIFIEYENQWDCSQAMLSIIIVQ